MVKLYRSCVFGFMRFFMVAAIFCLAAIKIFAQPLSGTGFTIDKTQPASTTNFTSFSSFFSKLALVGVSGPVEVSILNGPYVEQVQADAISGASATNTITVNGNGQILRYTASAIATAHTLRFNGADYVTIRNLTIEALGNTFAWAVHYMNNSDYNSLDHCSINVPNCSSFNSDNSHGVIVASNPSNIYSVGTAAVGLNIEGCVIAGAASNGPWNGIFINPQNSSTQADITITDNFVRDFRSVGLYLTNSRNVNVRSNRFARPNLSSVSTTYGILAINSCSNDTIDGNRIYNCFDAVTSPIDFYGIELLTVSDILLTNNIVYENNNLGKWIGLHLVSSPNIKVAHNTFSNDNVSTTAGLIYGFYHGFSCCNSSGTVFQNNIISITRGGTATRYGIYQDGSSISIDYNSLYLTGTKANYGWVSGADRQTFSSWQTALGSGSPFDNNSTSADPKYVNIGTGDLIPQSVMIDGTGVALGVQNDIAGQTRDNFKPDPGAFEFNVDANVSNIAMSNKGCQGEKDSVRVWIKNNSSFDISGFTVDYRVNMGPTIEQPYTGTILSGDSGIFVFNIPVTYSTAGSYNIVTRIGSKPFFGPYSIVIDPSPVGGNLAKGNVFNGLYRGGILVDPDVVASKDTIIYDFIPPTTINYGTYGTQWAISQISVKTDVGVSIGVTDTVFLAPTGGAAKVKFSPSASLTGKTLQIGLVAYSLTNGCKAPPVIREIYVAPKPVASFGFINVCQNLPVSFSNSSVVSGGTLTYRWKFGDGDSSKQPGPSKIYNGFGSFNVTLYAISDLGYVDSVTKVVTVYANPISDFTYKNKCEGSPIPFLNTSSAANGTPLYLWDFKDSSLNSTSTNPTHSYANPGLYNVSLKVTDAKGCVAITSKPVTFSKKPTAKFSFPKLTCNQKKVQFTNNSTPSDTTGYTWIFGDGDIATGFHIDHTYQDAGDYNVMLLARNRFDCVDTIVKRITLTESPQVDFKVSSLCALEVVQFINTTIEPVGSPVTYSWDFGDGVVETNKSVMHAYTSIGEYKVVLKAMANNLCSSEITKKLYFSEKPHVEFQAVDMACEGDFVVFNNGSIIWFDSLTYRWDFGDGRSSITETPTILFNTGGMYTVKLVATSGVGCSDSVSKVLTVSPIPNSNFTFESANMGNGTVIFVPEVIDGSGDYRWLYGDGLTGNEKVPHPVQYLTIGNKRVTLQRTDGHCSSTTIKDVLNPLGVYVPSYTTIGFSLYPNPTKGGVTVNVPQNTIVESISVYDVLGKQVLFKEYEPETVATLALNLNNLSNGIYTIKIKSENHQETFKISLYR